MPPLLRQVRWRILALLLLVTIINFVDRQSLSVVAPILRDQLRLSNTDYGFIVGAFQFGMMAGEFPMGWLMDRRGTRVGLSFAVLWWSIANALHSLARTRFHFAALRFWLGTGECGNYSGGMKVVSAWFPQRERTLAVGIFNGGSMIWVDHRPAASGVVDARLRLALCFPAPQRPRGHLGCPVVVALPGAC